MMKCFNLSFVCFVFFFFIKVIRKVDKQTALLDADDPVSQLHKVITTGFLKKTSASQIAPY